MNWTYIGIAALLPLTIALAATLLAGAIQAIRSNRLGGSSRAAFQACSAPWPWSSPLPSWSPRSGMAGAPGGA